MLLINARIPRNDMLFFFFNDTATTEIYTLSLHDALPISHRAPARTGRAPRCRRPPCAGRPRYPCRAPGAWWPTASRSEEHTSELQSRLHLVCRLLLEKKKKPSRKQPALTTPPAYTVTCPH